MVAKNPHTYKSRAIFIYSCPLSDLTDMYVYRLTPLHNNVQHVAILIFSLFGVSRTTTVYACTPKGRIEFEKDVVYCWRDMENPVSALHMMGYEAVDIPNTSEISLDRVLDKGAETV